MFLFQFKFNDSFYLFSVFLFKFLNTFKFFINISLRFTFFICILFKF